MEDERNLADRRRASATHYGFEWRHADPDVWQPTAESGRHTKTQLRRGLGRQLLFQSSSLPTARPVHPGEYVTDDLVCAFATVVQQRSFGRQAIPAVERTRGYQSGSAAGSAKRIQPSSVQHGIARALRQQHDECGRSKFWRHQQHGERAAADAIGSQDYFLGPSFENQNPHPVAEDATRVGHPFHIFAILSPIISQTCGSGFEAYLADTSYEVVCSGLACFDGQDFYGARLVVRAEDHLVFSDFDVADGASIVFQNSVHI